MSLETCVGIGIGCITKKTLLALPFIGGAIGMAVERAQGTLSIDVIKNWAIVVTVVSMAFYSGISFNKMSQFEEKATKSHERIVHDIEHEFKMRDYKLDYAYNEAMRGDRFTGTDGKSLRAEILENSAEDVGRHNTLLDRFGECNKRLQKMELKLSNVNGEI